MGQWVASGSAGVESVRDSVGVHARRLRPADPCSPRAHVAELTL